MSSAAVEYVYMVFFVVFIVVVVVVHVHVHVVSALLLDYES